jgi:hypothetical protein
MNRGEKLFFGTILATTVAGIATGYAVAEEQNSAPYRKCS